MLFLLDAATFLVFAVILSTVKEPLPDEPEAARGRPGAATGRFCATATSSRSSA